MAEARKGPSFGVRTTCLPGGNHRTEFEYDALGRQTLVRDPLGHETRYEYDALGRVVRTIYADDTTTGSAYDTLGRQISETDQLGRVKQYEYDAQGRLVAVVLPEVNDPQNTDELTNPRYEYEYDRYGNLAVIRDALGRETTFTYDAFGRQLTRTLPLGQTETNVYNVFGQLDYTVSFEGVVTQFIYDNSLTGQGRLQAKRYFADLASFDNGNGSPAEVTTYSYDAQGRGVQIVQDRDGNLLTLEDQRPENRAYSDLGQLTQVATPEGIINYAYDEVTNALVRTWTSSDTTATDFNTDTRYTYDAFGRLATVTAFGRFGQETGEAPTVYTYDAAGRLDTITLANGIISDYELDALGRVELLTHYGPDETLEDLSDNPIVASFDYILLPNGHRAGVVETDHEGNVTTIHWTYDNLDRLTREQYDSYDDTLDFNTTYVMDLVGNRLAKLTDSTPNGGDGILDQIITYTYDNNDRLLTELQDSDGDGVADLASTYSWGDNNTATYQTGKLVVDLTTNQVIENTTYSYNLQSRMSGVAITKPDDQGGTTTVTTTYTYDDSGIRVTQAVIDANGTTTTTFLIDANNLTGYQQVIEERTTGADTKTQTYTIGHDVVAQVNAVADQVLHLIYDAHGSTRILADAVGLVLPDQVFRYDSHGNPIGFVTANALTRLLYVGEQADAPTGMQYFRARYYDPSVGRFDRLDPFAGVQTSPLSLHKYMYAMDNPIYFYDPTGEFSLPQMLVKTSVYSLLATMIAIPAISAITLWNASGSSPDALIVTLGVSYGFRASVSAGLSMHLVIPFDSPGRWSVVAEVEGGLTPLTYYRQFSGIRGFGGMLTAGFIWNMSDVSELGGWGSNATFPLTAWRYLHNLLPGRPGGIVQRVMNFSQVFTQGPVQRRRLKVVIQFSQSSSGPAAIQLGGYSFALSATAGYSWVVPVDSIIGELRSRIQDVASLFTNIDEFTTDDLLAERLRQVNSLFSSQEV